MQTVITILLLKTAIMHAWACKEKGRRRKKQASKGWLGMRLDHTNNKANKAIQHTQGALGVLYCFALLFGYIVTFPKKNELPRAGVILTHDTPHSTSICTCAYIYMHVLHVYISLYTGIMGIH